MKDKINNLEALQFHTQGQPGKISIHPTKPLSTQRDLSLAYSPGVAAPCEEISNDPNKIYDYTAKGNMVAVISNGTAVLGLGNLGAAASKPVMEGKAVLFKKFADIDAIDLEVDTQDVNEFINCVRYLGPAFGGVNLEDIKAPECFVIEDKLKELMDIPVFHDDQHGTAICTAAGIINALHLTNRKMEETIIVMNGAGAASIACAKLLLQLGIEKKNLYMCDRKGVIYKGRKGDINPWKEEFVIETEKHTLEAALKGADVFIGLSVAGALTKNMLKGMAKDPIVFAMANPIPEIMPEEALSIRNDVIMATGRSDFPNQINNVLGFPYIFRGALDVHASKINDEMKIAAARALASLAREEVPEEVEAAYAGKQVSYGKDYIIPLPFDPRLITNIPLAVAKAAMESGVARKPIQDLKGYEKTLRSRQDHTYSSLEFTFSSVQKKPKRILFAEGEEEKMIRAAVAFLNNKLGTPVLIGRKDIILSKMEELSISPPPELEIINASLSTRNKDYTDYLYKRLQRKGYLYRDCQRLVHHDRNIFGACLLQFQEADGMVTGLTRTYSAAYDKVRLVIDEREDECVFGMSIVVAIDKTVMIADTNIHEFPEAGQLATIAKQAAKKAKALGHKPRVAFVSSSNFGNPLRPHADHIRDAIKMLDKDKVEFEYEGEISVHTALNSRYQETYPFCRLSGPANVLIMPDLHSANISSELLQEISNGTNIGPILFGLNKPVQIASMGAGVSDLLNLALIAANDSVNQKK